MFSQSISEVPIFNIPSVIQRKHLHPAADKTKFLLIPEEKLKVLKEKYKANGIYSKEETGCDFTLLVWEGKCFAIYLGKKPNQYSETGLAMGAGGYATIKAIEHLDIQNPAFFALKVQRSSLVANNEVAINQLINGIVKLGNKPISFEVRSKSDYKPQKTQFFHRKTKGMRNRFVMEIAQGFEAFEFAIRLLTERHRISEIRLLEIALQLAYELQKLHSQNILHSDIKLENIFVYSSIQKATATFLDHGFSAQLDNHGELHGHSRGTPEYLADEVFFTDEATYTVYSDIYSLGIVFAFLFGQANSEEVYVEGSEAETRHKVMSKPTICSNLGERLSKQAWQLARDMTNPFANQRLKLINVIDRLQNMIKSCEKKLKIAIVNIDECHGMRNDEKGQLFEKLKDYDDVLLAKNKLDESCLLDVALIRAEMQKNKIFVNANFFHANGYNVTENLPAYLASQHPSYIYDFDHVSVNNVINLSTSSSQFIKKVN